MQALQGFTLILLMQALGEGVVRLLRLPLPGPVIGLLLLLLALYWQPLRQPVQACADYLLSHLALLFVPISVGVISQLPLLQQYGGRIALVLLLSTAVGLAVTALVLRALMRPDAPPPSALPDTPPQALPERRHE